MMGVLLRRLQLANLLLGGFGKLQSPDQRHPVPGLPLEGPVGHQALDELVLLLDVHKPSDLLHFIPGALGSIGIIERGIMYICMNPHQLADKIKLLT